MKSITEQIGRRIKIHRELNDWSQAELAERIGGSLGKQSIISEIERGKRGIGVDELIVIADVLGVHVYHHLMVDATETLQEQNQQEQLSQLEHILVNNFRRLSGDGLRMALITLLMEIRNQDTNSDTE